MNELEYLKKYIHKEDNLDEAIKRLEAGEPVQYIVGDVDFYGNIIKVNKKNEIYYWIIPNWCFTLMIFSTALSISTVPTLRDFATPKEIAKTTRPTASSSATMGSKSFVSGPLALY